MGSGDASHLRGGQKSSRFPLHLPDLLCMPAHWNSRALWRLPTTFYWGRHLHLLHSSYCRGLSQWKNNPLQLLLPHQCPSSLLGPKDGTLPQILWRSHLCAEPLCKGDSGRIPPAPSGQKSHPGTEHSSQAAPRHLTETLTW